MAQLVLEGMVERPQIVDRAEVDAVGGLNIPTEREVNEIAQLLGISPNEIVRAPTYKLVGRGAPSFVELLTLLMTSHASAHTSDVMTKYMRGDGRDALIAKGSFRVRRDGILSEECHIFYPYHRNIGRW